MPFRLHTVDYVNAWPLTAGLASLEREAIVTEATPAACAAALKDGRADAALLPVGALPELSGCVVVPGLCIACRGAVDSVLLFSRLPWPGVRTVALDASSRTSVELVRLLLEWEGANPEYLSLPPDLEAMLSVADAALLIGDAALKAPRGDLRVMDLGERWHERTGLPFVFAIWAVRPGPEAPSIASALRASARWGLENLELLAEEAWRREGLPRESVLRYFRDRIVYDLGPEETRGMERFLSELSGRGRIPKGFRPEYLEGKEQAAP